MNFLNFLWTPRVCGKFCPLRNDNSTAQKSMSCISYKVKISYDDWTHVMVSDDDVTRILIILEFEFCCFKWMSPPLQNCPLRNAPYLQNLFFGCYDGVLTELKFYMCISSQFSISPPPFPPLWPFYLSFFYSSFTRGVLRRGQVCKYNMQSKIYFFGPIMMYSVKQTCRCVYLTIFPLLPLSSSLSHLCGVSPP